MEIPNESEDLEKKLIDLLYRSPNSKTMLREIAQKCGDTWRVDACLIVAGVIASESLQIGFWHTDRTDLNLSESFLSHSEISTVLANQQPILLSNHDLLEILSVQTLLGVRTEFQGTVNGLILLGKANPEPWILDEYEQLSQISKPVSIACMIATGAPSVNAQSQPENRLSEREFNPSLTLANFNRGVSIPEIPIIKKLYDLTRQQLEQKQYLLEQQRQLNQKKNDIIAAISDRARNPLATMRLAIDLLSNPHLKLPLHSQENYWNILRQEWNNLNELINSIVTLDQLESKEITLQPQPINLNSLIQKLAATFKEQWRQERRKPLTLTIDYLDSSIDFSTDLQHLESILQELLTNASHFSVAEQTVNLQLSQVELGEQEVVRIEITNTGVGIPSEEKESIYEPFYRGKEVIEMGIPGTGVGLAVVKGLVELLGGKIEMTSELADDSDLYVTSFTLTFPLNPDSNIN